MYPLQPLTGETLQYATVNNEDAARIDVSVSAYICCVSAYVKSQAFFDVKVSNAIISWYPSILVL